MNQPWIRLVELRRCSGGARANALNWLPYSAPRAIDLARLRLIDSLFRCYGALPSAPFKAIFSSSRDWGEIGDDAAAVDDWVSLTFLRLNWPPENT